MDLSTNDNLEAIDVSQITTELFATANHRGKLITEHEIDSFDNGQYRVIVVGKVRPYNKSNKLSAEQICQWYNNSVHELYEQIAGQFILFIYSYQQQTLSVVNDHIGSISCYYYSELGQTYFSTKLNHIRASSSEPLTLSKQAIFNYCYFHCIPAPITIFEHVNKLDCSEWLELTQGTIEHKGYLYQPEFVQKSERTADAKACFNIIENAVKLNISENCGAFLSGGLDSSTVAGMLANNNPQAKTYSVGFNEKGYDETEFAELTAKHFNTKHKTAYLPVEYISDNFEKIASSFDEPFGNSSALAAYFCACSAKQDGVYSLLAGDGGDEIFAGNSRYAKQKLFAPYEHTPSVLQNLSKTIFVKSKLSELPLTKKIASYIQQADTPLPDRLQSYNFLHRFPIDEIFTATFLSGVNQASPMQQLRTRYQQCHSKHPTNRMLFLDWKFTLADNDLIKVSKMCELAEVNVTFPLLEKEVIDFSCQISAQDKLPGNKLRHFFKQTMANFLAPETLSKPKHGFGLPFGRWMRTTPELIDLTERSLTRLKRRNIISDVFIDKALAMQKNEHSAYYGELIWILTVLELWLNQHIGAPDDQ